MKDMMNTAIKHPIATCIVIGAVGGLITKVVASFKKKDK